MPSQSSFGSYIQFVLPQMKHLGLVKIALSQVRGDESSACFNKSGNNITLRRKLDKISRMVRAINLHPNGRVPTGLRAP